MAKSVFVFNTGKSVPVAENGCSANNKMKRAMAEHLEYRGKGVIQEAPRRAEVVASKAVQAEAESLGVSLETVEGSGKDGRILKRDLQTYRTRMMTAQ